jgi:hypothetical protein
MIKNKRLMNKKILSLINKLIYSRISLIVIIKFMSPQPKDVVVLGASASGPLLQTSGSNSIHASEPNLNRAVTSVATLCFCCLSFYAGIAGSMAPADTVGRDVLVTVLVCLSMNYEMKLKFPLLYC